MLIYSFERKASKETEWLEDIIMIGALDWFPPARNLPEEG